MVAAVAEVATEVFDHPVAGTVRCMSPGCPNWFVRIGNRHRYCKAPNCTYKRGAKPAYELQTPEGAALELMLRLQEVEEESSEVGPTLLSHRRKKVVEAMRAGDRRALIGTLVDEAAVCIWWADRVSRNVPGQQSTKEAEAEWRTPGPARAVGLTAAVISSHVRTYDLAEHRHKRLWELWHAQRELTAAERGVELTAGSPKEQDAQVNLSEKRSTFDAAEAVYTAAEAAWRERGHALKDLTLAGSGVVMHASAAAVA